MIIALIHWRILPDEESQAAFLRHWKINNAIGDRTGLIAEFLSDSLPMSDLPIPITWHLDAESLGNFKFFVAVGLWDDADAFRAQVAKYFNDENPMEAFEKYRRRRVIFRPVSWRIGKSTIPAGDSPDVK